MVDEKPRWYKLVMETASLLQQDALEQAAKTAQDAFDEIKSITDSSDAMQALLRLYDTIKTHYSNLIDDDGRHLNDPLFVLAMHIAQRLTAVWPTVPTILWRDDNPPNIGWTMARLGYECIRGGESDTALSLFKGSIRFDTHVKAWEVTGFAEAMRKHERLDAAEEFLKIAHDHCGGFRSLEMHALLNLALCCFYQNDLDKAERYMKSLSALKQHLPANEFEKATQTYAQAVQASGQPPKKIRTKLGVQLAKPDLPGFSMDDPRC